MNTEFQSYLTTLAVPLLTAPEERRIRDLNDQWNQWYERSTVFQGSRIEPQFNEARERFLCDPSIENEHALMVLADTPLTARRYAVMTAAIVALRGRISAQAAQILHPHTQRIVQALQSELDRRMETATPVLSSIRRAPEVKEARQWTDYAYGLSANMLGALGGKSSHSPRELADDLFEWETEKTSSPETV